MHLIRQVPTCCCTLEYTRQAVYAGEVFAFVVPTLSAVTASWLATKGMCRASGCRSMSHNTDCSVNLPTHVSSAGQMHVHACRGQSNSIEVSVWQKLIRRSQDPAAVMHHGQIQSRGLLAQATAVHATEWGLRVLVAETCYRCAACLLLLEFQYSTCSDC